MADGCSTKQSESATPRYQSLDAEFFQSALDRYVNENKPDPLLLKQIRGWAFQWTSVSKNDGKSLFPDDLSFVPTDVLQGILTWKGDYMVAELESFCCWEHTLSEESASALPSRGSFYFVLKVRLRFRSKHDKKPCDGNKEEKNAEEKIRSKMMKRLDEDKFIKQLIPEKSKKGNKTSSEIRQSSTILCEARIHVKTPEGQARQFEERVDVTDTVAEGLRRALFSQGESALDVVEVLLSLPLLPGAAHANTIHCPLADRAKLRLFEDAMFDACEREGEDELIDDLKITTSQQENEKTEEEQQRWQKFSKRSRR